MVMRSRMFLSNDGGNVAIIFAMMAIPILGTVAHTVDYTIATKIKGSAQAAVDSANLAAAIAASSYMRDNPNASEAEAAIHSKAVAERYFSQNFTEEVRYDALYIVNVERSDGNWVAESSYTVTYQPMFTGVLGLEDWRLQGTSSAQYNKPFVPVLDIAMCIDATGSMFSTLNSVKINALSFYDNLVAELKKNDAGEFVQIRVRPIYYRDFAVDKSPLRASTPFILPAESSSFKAFVDPEMPSGGGDAPESGLECVNEAMDTKWVKVGDMVSDVSDPVTHVYPMIVIWTDAAALPFSHGPSLAKALYPTEAKMPRTAAAFTSKWNDENVIDQTNKQIVFFGNPNNSTGIKKGSTSGWITVKNLAGFSVGGTLTEGNSKMVPLIAKNVSGKLTRARLTD
jgi:Flp pilus assembly protein TadG